MSTIKYYEETEEIASSLFRKFAYLSVAADVVLYLTPLIYLGFRFLLGTYSSDIRFLPYKFSVWGTDINSSPHFEIWYTICVVGAILASYNFFVAQVFFVSVCLYVATCLKDLRSSFAQIGVK